jgi:hypothetical protein
LLPDQASPDQWLDCQPPPVQRLPDQRLAE